MAARQLILLALLAASLAAAEAHCKYFGGKVRTALLVADPGGFTGNAEAAYFLSNLDTELQIPGNSTVCAHIFVGKIMSLPVVVVTTGIGPITATLCVTELLQCRKYISEIVYMGTSGWSAQFGGVLNADPKPNPSKEVVRIGDVCVSPYSVNWECQLSDWTDQCAGYPNVNTYPGYVFDVTASFLYGQCIYTGTPKFDYSLTKDIVAAGRSLFARANAPSRSATVLYNEKIYWSNMTAATGTTYNFKKGGPTYYQVISADEGCTEIDGQFFYSGVPWDMSARNFTAIALNEAFGTTKFTQRNVIAVSAMESIGVGAAVQGYNKLNPKKPVPFTVVRGASNYLHNPLAKISATTWAQVPQFRDFGPTYAYAIATGSNTVLSWLRTKCTKVNGLTSPKCKFTIGYM